MELEKLESFLRDRGFYLSKKILTALYPAVVLSPYPVLLRGPAGTGKTELSKLIAEYLDAEYIFYQCTIGTTEEDLIYKLLPSEDTKSGIKIVLGPLPEALIKSKKKKTVLVLDEFDKTRPTADALLLDYLQNCRVSVRIKDEKVITGNPENLIVVLTSNDERDFSEPLLRRVVSVYLEPLPPKKVAEILKNKGVREDIVPLLTRLYEDTLNARLRKPATVQELQQLGSAINVLGDSADWTTLVRAYIIKDDMDWQKYREYLELGRDVEEGEEEEEDITEYYEHEHEQEDETEEEWKPRMPRITVKMSRNPEVSRDVKEDYTNEDIIVSMYMEHSEDNYDRVIKDFKPQPTDSPVQFADFRVVKEGEKTFIIKDKPLKLKDIVENLDIGGEQVIYSVYLKKIVGREVTLYIKDIVSLADFIQRFVESFKVVYYTRDLLRFKEGNTDFVLSKLEDSKWQLELVHETKTKTDTKNLEKVILEILRNHPVVRASSEFTRKVEEFIDSLGKQRVSAENSEQAKNIFMASETYRKIVNKVQTIREQVMKKYRVSEVHGTKNIKIHVRYRDSSWYSVDIPVVTFDKEIIMKVIL